jgi:hypothetical protein
MRRAAVRATFAPSVHNTQPWRFHLAGRELHIYADRTRQLPVLDPTSRQMTISIGCALLNARASLSHDQVAVEIARIPDRARPDLMAVIRPADDAAGYDAAGYDAAGYDAAGCDPAGYDAALAALDPVTELRQTNRRRFADDDVPDDVLDVLEVAAATERALLHIVRDPDERVTVAALSQRADDIENLNPSYRAELRAWTTSDPHRADGVPRLAVPHVDGRSGDEVPIRDFDTDGSGYLPAQTHSSRNQCLVLLCTAGDLASDWLRAGEALERVLLEITRHGFAASPLTQVTEVPSARAVLRRELSLVAFPHVLLRIGRAAATPASRRRRLVDVLSED